MQLKLRSIGQNSSNSVQTWPLLPIGAKESIIVMTFFTFWYFLASLRLGLDPRMMAPWGDKDGQKQGNLTYQWDPCQSRREIGRASKQVLAKDLFHNVTLPNKNFVGKTYLPKSWHFLIKGKVQKTQILTTHVFQCHTYYDHHLNIQLVPSLPPRSCLVRLVNSDDDADDADDDAGE